MHRASSRSGGQKRLTTGQSEDGRQENLKCLNYVFSFEFVQYRKRVAFFDRNSLGKQKWQISKLKNNLSKTAVFVYGIRDLVRFQTKTYEEFCCHLLNCRTNHQQKS